MVYQVAGPTATPLYTNLAPAIFILPYLLFSATSGQIADKLEKSQLIRITTDDGDRDHGAGGGRLLDAEHACCWSCAVRMGVQSTLFGPVKYSILPQPWCERELTGGNGLVEMGTFVSILLGMLPAACFAIPGDNGPVVAATASRCSRSPATW